MDEARQNKVESYTMNFDRLVEGLFANKKMTTIEEKSMNNEYIFYLRVVNSYQFDNLVRLMSLIEQEKQYCIDNNDFGAEVKNLKIKYPIKIKPGGFENGESCTIFEVACTAEI